MEGINVIAIDFEFTMIRKTTIILISGAISNIYQKAPVIKLKGIPLILQKGKNEGVELKRENINLVIRSIFKNLKGEEKKSTPLLNELNESMLTKTNNLNTKFIQTYCNYKNKKPVIITWNGHSDLETLKRLNVITHKLITSDVAIIAHE